MLIDMGRIEIVQHGSGIKFVHRDERGEPRRHLEKQSFMSSEAWKIAQAAWLSNYHQNMPLKRLDGQVVTVADYEGNIL